MTNKEISQKINEIGEMLEVLDANSFKISAYQGAARMIEMTSESLGDIYEKDGLKGLENIKGIGESIAEKIEELIKTGKIKYHQQLLKKVPEPILKFSSIPGVGPKTAKKLYETYKVKDIKDLKRALKSDKDEKDFKEKTRQNILQGIEIEKKIGDRMLLSFAEPIAQEIVETLKNYPEVKSADVVGSLRRMKETVGDIDIVAALQDRKSEIRNPKSETNSNNQKSNDQNNKRLIDRFVKEDFVAKIVNQGDTKATIINKNNVQIDLEILAKKEYGSLLQHFTGSKDHNIALRTWAEEHGFSISEHGIKKVTSNKRQVTNKIIKCSKEEEVYKTLGMDTPVPELRENRGEIEAALKHQLPKLVKLSDIKGDLHMHSTYSDGLSSIEEMAKYCKKLGYDYMAITDHPSTLGITQGLKEKDIDKYVKEIRRVSKKVGIEIFAGIEANIKPNGDIDLSDRTLKKFDIVLAAIHTSFRQDKETTTKRLIKAIQNPYVKIIAHPTGRLINRRPGVDADWEEIFKVCVSKF